MGWRSRPLFCRRLARGSRDGKKRRLRIHTAERRRKMMRVLIVDDEPLSRSALADALAARNDIEALDSAHDAIEALEMLDGKSYDVLLLDIHMPELSEIERAASLMKVLPQLERLLSKSVKIAIKTKGRILFIDPADVAIVEAEGNYVLLQRHSGSYLLRESISTVAEKLKAYGFIRIHRSVLVNSSFVEEIQPWSTGEYVLRIKGGKEFTVSRTYKSNLKSLARLWVGTDPFVTE